MAALIRTYSPTIILYLPGDVAAKTHALTDTHTHTATEICSHLSCVSNNHAFAQ